MRLKIKLHIEDFKKYQPLAMKMHGVDLLKMKYFDIFYFVNHLQCVKECNIPFLHIEDYEIVEGLKFMYYYQVYALMVSDEMARKYINHFLFKSIIKCLCDDKRKLFLFSCHDMNLLSMLATLSFIPKESPDYGSNIIINLMEHDGHKYVTINYNNQCLNKQMFGTDEAVSLDI